MQLEFNFRFGTEGASRLKTAHRAIVVPSSIFGASKAALMVLAVACVMNLLGRGFMETHAIFMLSLEQEFDWTRTEVSGIYSIAMLTFGLTGPGVGFLLDRLGPPKVYTLGLLLIIAGLILSSTSDSLWVFRISQGMMMGFGAGCLSTVSLTALLSRWFQSFLSIAMAFAYASAGIGIMVFSPLVEMLNSEIGWRHGYQTLALVGLAGLPLSFILYRLKADDGNPVLLARIVKSGGTNPRVQGVGVRQAIQRIEFWGLTWVYFMTGVGSFTVLLQTPAYLVEMGYSTAFAARAFGFVGLLSPLGIIGITVLSRRYGQTPVILVSYGLSFLGVVFLLLFEQTSSLILLILFILCYGGTFGCRAPAISNFAAQNFNGPAMGRIYGLITIASGLGGATGAFLGGFFFEQSGHYQFGAYFSMGMFLIGNLPFWVIPGLTRWKA
ncbi:MAG: MFS transporter [SAR324 cluster bacterium]|nr:MFS transporter [SAR324 cluster bacterium]